MFKAIPVEYLSPTLYVDSDVREESLENGTCGLG